MTIRLAGLRKGSSMRATVVSAVDDVDVDDEDNDDDDGSLPEAVVGSVPDPTLLPSLLIPLADPVDEDDDMTTPPAAATMTWPVWSVTALLEPPVPVRGSFPPSATADKGDPDDAPPPPDDVAIEVVAAAAAEPALVTGALSSSTGTLTSIHSSSCPSTTALRGLFWLAASAAAT